MLTNARPASAAALSTERIFTPDGALSWKASQGQAQGSSVAAPDGLLGGSWRPIATDSQGREMPVQSITVSGNAAAVSFAGGASARYSFGGTGVASALPGSGALALTIQRNSADAHGLALYEADPLTGAILTGSGQRLQPWQPGYLQSALASATALGLVVPPERLPATGAEALISDLPLKAGQNYGLLLLRHNNPADLASSFAAANPGRAVMAQTFAAPGRGVIFGLEEQPVGSGIGADFADLIVSVSGSDVNVF
ncbi:MAG: hypothetical protein FJ077_11930 [Cyanobacteria bacterium K_DeepCast_35m_m2_023]|nr:hypothetical protein [Cyanobacteria bacterium K_DeepCast_35m_m2_023]